MTILNLPEGTHTIKWTLSNYNDLIVQIKVSSNGIVTCINVTNGTCGGTGVPRIVISGTTVTGFLKYGSVSPTPTPTITPTPTQSPPPNGYYYQIKQAENYVQLEAPMSKSYNQSSEGNYYIHNPAGHDGGGFAKYEFNTPIAGRYKLFALVEASNDSRNSFKVRIDNQQMDVWDIAPKSGWQWVHISKRGNGSDTKPQYPIYYNDIGPGKHTIYIYDREQHTKLRKFVVTNDLAFVPGSTIPTPTPTPSPTNSYDNWVISKGGKPALKNNLAPFLEMIDGYMGFQSLGFTVTLMNLLDTIDAYLGIN